MFGGKMNWPKAFTIFSVWLAIVVLSYLFNSFGIFGEKGAVFLVFSGLGATFVGWFTSFYELKR
jgi:hypothetical protein